MIDLLRNDRRNQVHRLVLEPAAPRRLTIHDTDGKPIQGARVAPRIVQTELTSYLGVTIPDDWLERCSALTDERGIAALPSFSRKIDLRSGAGVGSGPRHSHVDAALLEGQGRCHPDTLPCRGTGDQDQ